MNPNLDKNGKRLISSVTLEKWTHAQRTCFTWKPLPQVLCLRLRDKSDKTQHEWGQRWSEKGAEKRGERLSPWHRDKRGVEFPWDLIWLHTGDVKCPMIRWTIRLVVLLPAPCPGWSPVIIWLGGRKDGGYWCSENDHEKQVRKGRNNGKSKWMKWNQTRWEITNEKLGKIKTAQKIWENKKTDGERG